MRTVYALHYSLTNAKGVLRRLGWGSEHLSRRAQESIPVSPDGCPAMGCHPGGRQVCTNAIISCQFHMAVDRTSAGPGCWQLTLTYAWLRLA